ncbi:hypothetical protein GCM10023116_13390 [Kistimonas scapharcae]|uniref:Uncharacterized protein n=1 Tax=Kistimonas scapharcae TaxID=1036133 RepID=A0ABP8UYZ3_9GAMM
MNMPDDNKTIEMLRLRRGNRYGLTTIDVDTEFDKDGEVSIEVERSCSCEGHKELILYLNKSEVIKLRDHLNKLLTTIETNHK